MMLEPGRHAALVRGLAALILAAPLGCGGAAAEGGAREIGAPHAAEAPKDARAPEGWAVLDRPEFFALIPAGFRETKSDAAGAPGTSWTASRNGTSFTVSLRTLAGDAEFQTERTLDSFSAAFFRTCGGERVRMERADTLEHKTVTVDGTCGKKPAMGQVHMRGGIVVELYVVVEEGALPKDQDEVRGFFRAFRLKSK